MTTSGCIYAFSGSTSSETMATNLEAEPGEADDGEDVCMMGDEAKCAATPVTTRTVGALAHLFANCRPCFEQNGCTTDGTTWVDTLFFTSLLKCLTWHDGPTCLKASQWICPLIDLVRSFDLYGYFLRNSVLATKNLASLSTREQSDLITLVYEQMKYDKVTKKL